VNPCHPEELARSLIEDKIEQAGTDWVRWDSKVSLNIRASGMEGQADW